MALMLAVKTSSSASTFESAAMCTSAPILSAPVFSALPTQAVLDNGVFWGKTKTGDIMVSSESFTPLAEGSGEQELGRGG